MDGIRVPFYRLTSAGTAQNTFTTERVLHDIAGAGARPVVPANTVKPGDVGVKAFYYRAMGIVGCTGTPTFTWTLRLGSNASTTAAIVAGTAALTMQSGVTNQTWWLEAEIIPTIIGDAGANSTVRGTGVMHCMGIASPFMGIFNASASATAPTVATVDWSIANYFNLNIACSASNVANTVQLLSEAVDLLVLV